MNKWRQTSIGEFIEFNPSERLTKNSLAKKVPMEKLGIFERKIKGFELSEYSAGPKFRNGDTLVAKITPCLENGKTALVDILDEDEVAFGSSEFIVLRENEFSDKQFIYYLARSPLFRERAISCMEGTSGRKRVNEGALKRQEILVPELTEQQKIASVLSALDDKIELNNRINAELEQMAKTLYDYWFVQFDFPDVNGKPYKSSGGKMVYNEVLKREIPQNWEVKKLEELGTLKNGINYDPKLEGNSLAKIINVRNISQSTIFIENSDLDELKLNQNEIDKYLVDERSIIIARSGTPGATRLIKNFEPNTIYCGFIICLTVLDSKYFNVLYYNLKDFEKNITSQSNGTIMKNVNQQVLNDFNIVVPRNRTLERYNLKVDSIFAKILNNLKQNQQLSALRDWLLPMLMNGQVKVADVINESNLKKANNKK